MWSATCIEWLGYVAAIFTTGAFVPQAIKTIRTRETQRISLGMVCISTLPSPMRSVALLRCRQSLEQFERATETQLCAVVCAASTISVGCMLEVGDCARNVAGSVEVYGELGADLRRPVPVCRFQPRAYQLMQACAAPGGQVAMQHFAIQRMQKLERCRHRSFRPLDGEPASYQNAPAGAIEDFREFLDRAEYAEGLDDVIVQRSAWVAALERNENPLTPAVLAQLRSRE